MEYEVQRVKDFVRAGKAVFTIKNEETGNRFTFRVKKPDQERDFWFVNVLNGPNNHTDFLYIGSIFGQTFRTTNGSRVNEEAPSYKAFDWFWKRVQADSLPEKVKVYHQGRCGRCARRLTVPESIQSGFGPECIQMV